MLAARGNGYRLATGEKPTPREERHRLFRGGRLLSAPPHVANVHFGPVFRKAKSKGRHKRVTIAPKWPQDWTFTALDAISSSDSHRLCAGNGRLEGKFSVLDELRSWIFGKREPKKSGQAFRAEELQLAEAALMFHVIAADGTVTEAEKRRLEHQLSQKFGLSEGDTKSLIEEARLADSEAVDLYTFTRTLKRELDPAARLSLVRELWQMVYADGQIHEFEDNIVWRVAELLDVEARDRMALKQSVRPGGGHGG